MEDWALPGAPAAPAAPADGSAVPGAGAPVLLPPPRRPVDAAPAARLVPLGLLALLDDAVGLLRRRPGTVLGLSAVFVVPPAAFGAALGLRSFGPGPVGALTAPPAGGDVLAALGASALASLAFTWLTAALCPVVVAERLGAAPVRFRAALRSALRRAPSLTLAWLVGGLCKLLVACTVVGWFLVVGLFLVAAPVVAAEDAGGWAALRRSARLTRPRLWHAAWFAVLSGGLAAVLTLVLSAVPSALGALDADLWWLAAASSLAVGLVTTPIVAAATVGMYLDLRVRTEGLDLELDLPRVFPPAGAPSPGVSRP